MQRLRGALRAAALRIGPVNRLYTHRDTLLRECEGARRDSADAREQCEGARREAAALAARCADLEVERAALLEQHQAIGQERDALRQTLAAVQTSAPPLSPAALYEWWFQSTFGTAGKVPNTHPATSWPADNLHGAQIASAMAQVEAGYAEGLLAEIADQQVPGDIVEFGVFEGHWLEVLIHACERLGLHRAVWGFDSFEGLPAPSPQHDLDCFAQGDFSAGLPQVAARLEVDRRPHVRLVKGWFSDTLPMPEVQSIGPVAFARIDCDLYGPSVECLDFLAGRLSDKAILVFDDWTFDLNKGETRSFAEWRERQPGYRFEFLCFNSVGHLYMRVHHV